MTMGYSLLCIYIPKSHRVFSMYFLDPSYVDKLTFSDFPHNLGKVSISDFVSTFYASGILITFKIVDNATAYLYLRIPRKLGTTPYYKRLRYQLPVDNAQLFIQKSLDAGYKKNVY